MIVGAVVALTLHFIHVTGPAGQAVEISIDQIVSLREPRKEEGHFAKEVNCLVHTSDGKFVAVRETCAQVRELLMDAYQRREDD